MDMKQDIKNVLQVLLAIVLGLLVCWLLSGCSPRIVEVERPVVVEQTHTSNHVDIVRDTLIWRDSVYHFVQGDTVVIERWHNVVRVERVAVADTVRDTIPRVVTVRETRIEEVEKPLAWWQSFLCWVGGLALAVGGVTVAWKFYKP